MSGIVGVVFPGQGTQRPGMGARFCAASRAAQDVFDRANETLGRDLRALCFQGSPETLRQTENAQPALFAANAAAFALLAEFGVTAEFVAGHSVGEFSACYAGGALSFEQALLAVEHRAQLMAHVEEEGAMVAVFGLEQPEVEALCEAARGLGEICVAAHNAPNNFVCSGATRAVERVEAMARARGALRVNRLATSHAFHSPLMSAAAPAWRTYLAGMDFEDSGVPVALNTTGELSCDRASIHRAAADQLDRPIRWVSCVQAMLDAGARVFIEAGESKVLSAFIRACSPEATAISMGADHGLRRIEALSGVGG